MLFVTAQRQSFVETQTTTTKPDSSLTLLVQYPKMKTVQNPETPVFIGKKKKRLSRYLQSEIHNS
ncbi:MAG TPA: hypothetical protein PK239_11470 [Chitinophagales bacterium]|nr:hypothetical protein [Chitinophagales bacterium]